MDTVIFSRPSRIAPLLLAALGACGAEAEPVRNFLLVSIDTLRADHMGLYGYERETTPNLDRFAATAGVFDRAYATSSWTLPSLASLMTSLYPSTHGCRKSKSSLPAGIDTMAERLTGAGFHTGAVTSHVYLAPKFGLASGFAEYDDDLVREDIDDSHRAVSSPPITEKGLAWLEARAADERRWFLWLHYFDPHFVYRAHQEISERFGSDREEDRYDGEIRLTDLHIGRVLDRLDELGFSANTLVVVATDHGEEFEDHGGTGHRKTLFEEVIRAALLIRAPGLSARRVAEPVSLVDVAPTVYELLDVKGPDLVQGRSLVSALRGEPFVRPPVVAELGPGAGGLQLEAVVDGDWKLVRERFGESWLYDLEHDPGEQRDLSAAEPEVHRRLTIEVQGLVQSFRRSGAGFGSEKIELSPEEGRALESLGYAGEE